MVHRIGDTLLIDEFNASEHLVVQKKNRNWDWLKKFFSENFSESSEIVRIFINNFISQMIYLISYKCKNYKYMLIWFILIYNYIK